MSRKDSDRMTRGKKVDSLGRLDHTKGADERAKNKRNWQHDLETEMEDAISEWNEIAEHLAQD